MRGQFSKNYSNLNAAGVIAVAPFELVGGVYVVDVIASAFGTITLQRLGPDGTTKINAATATSFTANGTSDAVALPPGQYSFTATGVTGAYITITRVAGE